MATITELKLKSGDPSYKAVIKKDGKILKSKRWSTRKAALTWANRIENDHEMMEALSSDAATMTFKVLADDYITWWRTQDRKDQGTEARIQWWSDRLGDKKVLDIQDRHIRKILDTYAQGKAKRGNGRKKSKVMDRPRKPATINRMRSGLCAVFKYANKIKGYKIPSPVKYIPTLTENNKRVRYLSDDERKALLDACKASKWDKLHLLVMMAITTGARLGELLGLSWSDIDFPARTATLNVTKNGERRVLTLAPVTIKTLTPFRGFGRVFPAAKNPNQPFEFRPFWNKALKDSGIENFRFHDLRHSAASYLVMNGATLHECAEVLGHKSIETTKRYAHLSVGHKQALTDRVMGDIFND